MDVSCLYCDQPFPMDELDSHETACLLASKSAAQSNATNTNNNDKDDSQPDKSALAQSDGQKSGKKNKNVQFHLALDDLSKAPEPSISRGKRAAGENPSGSSDIPIGCLPNPANRSNISGGATPPETYVKRQKLKNRIEVRDKFSGLLNQGATCYMNSLLQTLFLSSDFRKELLTWEIPPDMRTDLNVPFQLQSLFARLKDGKKSAVDTKGLTKSFRWTSSQHFAQHDVQELNRVLFEALQKYIDHLKGNNFIVDLFEGKLSDYIKCKTCGGRRERVDTFQDITLAIKNTSSIMEALEKFVEAECMEGDNEINCDECNSKQPSLKGLGLKSVPPVLTVQLRRFDFDFETLRREKVYDDIDIPEEINLSPFLADSNNGKIIPSDKRQLFLLAAGVPGLLADLLRSVWPFLSHHTYELFSVLAHRGTTSGGHYIAYIRDLTLKGSDRKWYTFNDEHVTLADECPLLECIHPQEWQRRYDELNPPAVSRSAPSGSVLICPDKQKVTSDFFLESNTVVQALGFVNGRTIVTEVDYDSPFYKQSANLHPGDVIHSLNGKLIPDLKTWDSFKFEPVSVSINLRREGVKMQVKLTPTDAKHIQVSEVDGEVVVLESIGVSILPGDVILSAAGERMLSPSVWSKVVSDQASSMEDALSTRISMSPTITVIRNSNMLTFPLNCTASVVSVACDDSGLLIAEVSDPETAHLQQGDKIQTINGKAVTLENWNTLKDDNTPTMQPQHKSDISIGRGHGLAELAERQEYIKLRYDPLADVVKSVILKEGKLVVSGVLPGDAGQVNHLAAGDVIVSANGEALTDFEGWHQAKKTENVILVVAKGADVTHVESSETTLPVQGCAPPPPPPPPPPGGPLSKKGETITYSPTDGNVNSVIFKNDMLIVSEVCTVPTTPDNSSTTLLAEGDVIYSANNDIMENIDMWTEIEQSHATSIPMIIKRGAGLKDLQSHREQEAKHEIKTRNGEASTMPDGLQEIILFASDYSNVQLNDSGEVESSTSPGIMVGDIVKFVNQVRIASDLEFRTLCGSETTNGGMATLWVDRSKTYDSSIPADIIDDDDGCAYLGTIFEDYPPPTRSPMASNNPVAGQVVHSRLPAVTSRMYPYMVVYRLRSSCPEQHSASAETPVGDLPDYLKELVKAENDEFDQEIADYEAVKDLIELKAYYNNCMKWCICKRADSVWDVTKKAAELFGLPTEDATPETLRIRHFLESSSVPGRSVIMGKEQPHEVPVEEVLGLSSLSAICVQTRTAADPEFQECALADIKLYCSVYRPPSEEQDPESDVPPPTIILSAASTLQQLVDRVEAVCEIPKSELYVIVSRGYTPVILFSPEMASSETLTEEARAALEAQVTNTHDISNLETLHVESSRHACDPEVESAKYGDTEQTAVNSINKIRNAKLCQAEYWFPGHDEVQGEFYFPRLAKCSEIKEKIAQTHGIDKDSFTMTCVPNKMARKGRSMEEPKKPLQAFVTNKHANILLTESAVSGGITIDVYYVKKKPGKATFFYTAPGVSLDTEVIDFKKSVCWDSAELSLAGITFENCRYRRFDTKRQKADVNLCGSVMSRWVQECSATASTISIVLEEGGPDDEELSEASLFLWIQQFFPSERKYGCKKEVVLRTDSRLFELVECLTDYTGGEGDPNNVPNERIRILDKPLTNHLSRETTPAIHTGIQWNSVTQNSSTWQLKRCGYNQNDLILFCDGTDLEKADGSTPSTESGGKKKMDLFLPSVAKNNKSTEKGIVIKTEWDNDSPVEESLVVAGPENKPDQEPLREATVWTYPDERHDDEDDDNQDDSYPPELEEHFRLYDDEFFEHKECSICLEEYHNGDSVFHLHCDYVLHTKCLYRWYKSTGNCPMCKAELRPDALAM